MKCVINATFKNRYGSLKYMAPKKISAVVPILVLARIYKAALYKRNNMLKEKIKSNV